ncbi:MAG: EamA family transporter RarD [Solimonas sp.]
MSRTPDTVDSRRGFMAAFGAFLTWGLLPLYISLLKAAGSVEIMAHRVAWACLFLFGWIALRGELGKIGAVLRDRAVMLKLLISAAMISINWLLYVWAIGNGQVIEASLGYFINPLVSILLGVFVLRERLTRAQWLAVGIAALGVIWLSVQVGRPPWIALSLAGTFALYGLVRKMAIVEAIAGLGIETLLITPFMLAYLGWEMHDGSLQFLRHGTLLAVLLVASGVITAIPLVMFAYGVRRVPLTTIGVMQYVAPTLQFLCGVFFFHETFTPVRAVGFGFIWAALFVYAGEGLWRARRVRPALATT